MKGLYLRWAVILSVAVVIGWLAAQHYDREVRTLSPEQLLQTRPQGTVRVMGMVQAGSLTHVPQGNATTPPPDTPVPSTQAPKSPPPKNPPMILAEFTLEGAEAHLLIHYDGPEDDNLRELKTLVVVGHLNAAGSAGLTGAAGPDGLNRQRFEAHELDLLPNYGFITAAYLLALVPLALFLFGMERRVALLYTVIKGTTAYQPEAGAVE